MFSYTKSGRFNASSFQVIKDGMLQSDKLPLSEFIDDDSWQAMFEEHGINFGNDEGSVYTPAVTLWGLISQVFFKGKKGRKRGRSSLFLSAPKSSLDWPTAVKVLQTGEAWLNADPDLSKSLLCLVRLLY